MEKLQLPNVTLIALATRDVEQTVKALNYSCLGIDFGEVKLVSDYKPNNMTTNITWSWVHKMKDIEEWNYEVFYNLWKYVDTEFAMFIHADGFIIYPEQWRKEFLDYDYIGAPWPLDLCLVIHRENNCSQQFTRVGNSVGIRSRKLMMLPTQLNIPWKEYNGRHNEDTQICAHNRNIFLANGIKYAPLELAVHFSHEAFLPEIQGIKPFMFHKWDHQNKNFPRL